MKFIRTKVEQFVAWCSDLPKQVANLRFVGARSAYLVERYDRPGRFYVRRINKKKHKKLKRVPVEEARR